MSAGWKRNTRGGSMVLLVCAAGALNWKYTGEQAAEAVEETGTKILGEATLVSGQEDGGEAGTDGTVHHAGRQRALVGRTRLALEVASRDAADRVHLLDEVDREGEEVVVLLLLRDDGRNEHRRVALRDDDRAGRLLGELACLQTVLLPVQFEGFDDFFHMLLSLSSPERP